MPQPESGSVQPHKLLPSSDAKSELRGAPVDAVLSCHKLEKPVLLIILPYLPIYHEIVQIHFILINYRKEDTHLFLQLPLNCQRNKSNQIPNAVLSSEFAWLVLFFQTLALQFQSNKYLQNCNHTSNSNNSNSSSHWPLLITYNVPGMPSDFMHHSIRPSEWCT